MGNDYSVTNTKPVAVEEGKSAFFEVKNKLVVGSIRGRSVEQRDRPSSFLSPHFLSRCEVERPSCPSLPDILRRIDRSFTPPVRGAAVAKFAGEKFFTRHSCGREKRLSTPQKQMFISEKKAEVEFVEVERELQENRRLGLKGSLEVAELENRREELLEILRREVYETAVELRSRGLFSAENRGAIAKLERKCKKGGQKGLFFEYRRREGIAENNGAAIERVLRRREFLVKMVGFEEAVVELDKVEMRKFQYEVYKKLDLLRKEFCLDSARAEKTKTLERNRERYEKGLSSNAFTLQIEDEGSFSVEEAEQEYGSSDFDKETEIESETEEITDSQTDREANYSDETSESEVFHDSDGYYDQFGFDEDGYDQFGFDEDGYDQFGFDEDGYDRKGFDRKGFDRDGYDEEGVCYLQLDNIFAIKA